VTITKIEDTFVFDKINESCKEKWLKTTI
jgi:hypothetical protein